MRSRTLAVMAAAVTATALATLSPMSGALAVTTPSPSAASQSTSNPTTTPGVKKVLTVGIVNDVDSLNPLVGLVVESYEVWGVMYDYLTGYSAKDFSAVPSLAISWTTSADGLTWTYTIRSGVRWSDGQALTARDAAYTFNRILTGEAEKTNYGSYVANIVSAAAPDDTTLVLRTKVPSPIMLHLAVPILPEHIWKLVPGKAVPTFKNDPAGAVKPVGSGPYVLTERKVGQYVRLAANPSYWGGAPHMDELVFKVFSSPEALSQALRKGEIDFADSLEANVFDALKGQPGITTVPAKYSGFNEIAFNVGAALTDGTPIGDGHPALQDKRVRVALSHAVDLDTILKRAIGGYGEVATGVIPSMYSRLHYDAGPTKYSFDIGLANRLLDEAGYQRGKDGIRTMPDGSRPLVLRFFSRAESKPSQTTMQYVVEWFAQLGVKVVPKTISEDQLTEAVTTGDFDLFEWGWVVEPDPDFQLSTFTCDQRSSKDGGEVLAGLSDGFYCNPAYDALYAKQATQIDPAARAETVKAMQKLLYDDAPYLVEYYYDNLQAYRSDKVAGFVPQPDPDGVLLFQYGNYSYRNVMTKADYDAAQHGTPGAGSGTGTAASSVSATVVVLGLFGFGAFFGGGYALGRRNRRLEDVRE